MSDTSNSPKVNVTYTASGFTASFEVGWKHTDGHDKFRRELVLLLDDLHKTWNQHERQEDHTERLEQEPEVMCCRGESKACSVNGPCHYWESRFSEATNE